jgi:hypothetical protein
MDKHQQTLILTFNKIFSISSGALIPHLGKALPVSINLTPVSMISRVIILFICVCICGTCFCQKINVLSLKNTQHFTEINKFWTDSTITLYQEVSYDVPLMKDEEYCYYLILTFKNVSNLIKKSYFDLTKDSAFVNVECKRNSVWDWSSLKKINTGNIKILSQSKKYIEVELSLSMINDNDKYEFSYTGIRRFSKGKKPAYFERAALH